jgi:hypothetical protein
VANFLLEATDPAVLTTLARALPPPSGILHTWLPQVTRNDHRYRFFRSDRSAKRAAPVRPWNTPAVPLERGGTEEVTGRMLPMSVIMWLLEEESQLLDAARASGDDARIAAIFGKDVVTIVRAIQHRIMIMQGEAISAGQVTIGTAAQPENSLQLGAQTFGVDALSTAGVLWSAATPGILAQITNLTRAYSARTGGEVKARVQIWSPEIMAVAVQDPEFRALFGTMVGTPSAIGEDQVNELFAKLKLPEIVVDDTEVVDQFGVSKRLIPPNQIVLLPDRSIPVGQTQFGVTEEAKKLARAQVLAPENMAGFVIVPMESENPVHTGTLGSAIAFPVVTEPDLITNHRVIT